MVRIDFNRLRFLVVDDNPHMRRIVRTLLHGLGTRDVFEADDGATGLDAYTDNVPDIVLIDWAMPVFDGLELTRMIRETEDSVNPYVDEGRMRAPRRRAPQHQGQRDFKRNQP